MVGNNIFGKNASRGNRNSSTVLKNLYSKYRVRKANGKYAVSFPVSADGRVTESIYVRDLQSARIIACAMVANISKIGYEYSNIEEKEYIDKHHPDRYWWKQSSEYFEMVDGEDNDYSVDWHHEYPWMSHAPKIFIFEKASPSYPRGKFIESIYWDMNHACFISQVNPGKLVSHYTERDFYRREVSPLTGKILRKVKTVYKGVVSYLYKDRPLKDALQTVEKYDYPIEAVRLFIARQRWCMTGSYHRDERSKKHLPYPAKILRQGKSGKYNVVVERLWFDDGGRLHTLRGRNEYLVSKTTGKLLK